ncbi:MAG: NAD(P)/FAD-dependent oxidoreductase [Bacteroidales bacterium]|nr:NAD(P)/FAD-dependent oxidoreductase [Bacteroidales bacterium]
MSDLIIIGCGPGGYQAAAYAAKNGLTVTIVEQEHAGGTCLNCGCIPTKALCHDAELVALGLPADFGAAMARKEAVVAQLRGGVEQLMAMPGITLVRGRGELQSDGSVLVTPVTSSSEDGEGSAEPLKLTAAHIMIATGSRAKLPPIPGIDLPGVVTSTELLSIGHLPARLCIVGAGVIGLELAGVFAAYGTQVTVVEFMKECLPQMDSDIAKRLRKQMEKRGIVFHLGAAVQAIERGPSGEPSGTVTGTEMCAETGANGAAGTEAGANRAVEMDANVAAEAGLSLLVSFEKKGKVSSVEADVVLVATGRAANVEGLGAPATLAALGIQTDRRGILVDPETFEVLVPEGFTAAAGSPRIFAIGDVNGRQMLAHAAEAQAHRVVNQILGRADGIRLDVMPAAVFTTPEAACVGPTEDQLKEAGVPFVMHKGNYRANGRALCIGETEGLVKIITDEHDRILACHILGAHAADLVQEVTAYINLGATLQQLRDTVHIHPTLSEVLREVN